MHNLTIVAFDRKNQPHIRAIRDAVFIHEQNIDPELEFDGLDNAAMHVLVAVDDQYVGTGRMLDDGHIGRIAILRDFRGRGLGGRMVQALVDEAVSRGYPRVYLGAQKQAIGFYARLGFIPFGEEFMEAGIPHLSMEKPLV
ncbi:GNAT family N-acetyltransferase [Oceanisphaera psychrotolerans]|uniref:GNAT family N-acetyltransferase n=1 Tax=Oceanisphaera psychrotolerans TaxID=1414654 RepID=A0A1J4QAY8_9GAMM|nr:GNAT family N-acetyltransferase [Oceanisphaera psychrotolerans]OIN05592.1 GNAT family N-acetyltransferase [Oceanisphaera psychrotolerans]